MTLDPTETRNIQKMNTLIQQIRNDITGNAERARTIKEFLAKVGVYTNVNPFWTTQYNESTMKIIQDIMQPMEKALSGLPLGGHRVLFQEVAKNYTMDLVTRMGDDMKDQLRTITSQGLAEGKSHIQIAKDMDDKVASMGRTRAEVIAQTETHRAKNLGNWYKYKEAGYKYFTVSYASNACPKCVAAYHNVVFSIDDIHMLPPFHHRCRCAAKFHREIPEGYKLYKRDFKAVDDLNNYVDSSGWINRLKNVTKDEAQAVLDYQKDSGPINYFLRTGKVEVGAIRAGLIGETAYIKELQSQINLINSAINKSRTLEDLRLWAGVKDDIPQLNDLKIGSKIRNLRGFRSTSTDRWTAETFADKTILEVEYPAGSKGLPVNKVIEQHKLTPHRNEDEILLPDDTSWEVTNIYESEEYNIIRIKPL